MNRNVCNHLEVAIFQVIKETLHLPKRHNALAWFVLSGLHSLSKWLLVAAWFHFVVFLLHDPSISSPKTHLEVGLKVMQCFP